MRYLLVRWVFFSLANHQRLKKVLLAKTTESFKLADLQTMEGRIQAHQDGRYTCERILLDQRTGSSILSLQLPIDMGIDAFIESAPTSLQRCEWIGLVQVHESNVEDYLKEIESVGGSLVASPWSLDYLKLQAQKPTGPTTYTSRSLLCCVAQRIPSPSAALNPQDAREKLLILDLDSKELYLVKELRRLSVARDSEIRNKWSARPYKYSSAINFAIAEIAIDLLQSLLHTTEGDRPILLDPTCGSGKLEGERVRPFLDMYNVYRLRILSKIISLSFLPCFREFLGSGARPWV